MGSCCSGLLAKSPGPGLSILSHSIPEAAPLGASQLPALPGESLGVRWEVPMFGSVAAGGGGLSGEPQRRLVRSSQMPVNNAHSSLMTNAPSSGSGSSSSSKALPCKAQLSAGSCLEHLHFPQVSFIPHILMSPLVVWWLHAPSLLSHVLCSLLTNPITLNGMPGARVDAGCCWPPGLAHRVLCRRKAHTWGHCRVF